MNVYDDDFEYSKYWTTLVELLAPTIEPKPQLHKWLPAGLSLLAGKAKAGKSTVAEQIASGVSRDHKVCYLALEYNERTAQARFDNFENLDNVHTVIEGQIAKFGKGAEEDLKDMVSKFEPALLVIDVLAKLKRPNMGNYDQEYEAMSELKELVDEFDIDCSDSCTHHAPSRVQTLLMILSIL